MDVKAASRSPRLLALTRKPTLKAIAIRSKHSLDSSPETKDPFDIDVFDRSNSPTPRSKWQSTLIHASDAGGASHTNEAIDMYYSSKEASKADDIVGDGQQSGHGSSTSSIIAAPSFKVESISARKAEEVKRNSILFPKLSQDEIDEKMLEVCERRYGNTESIQR